MTPAGRIREAFGLEGDPWALFCKTPIALRFELGGDWSNIEQPVPRVTQALTRARAVCDAVFPAESALTAVIATVGGTQEPLFDRTPDGKGHREDPWAALPAIGFTARASEPVVELLGQGDEAVPYLWRTADLTGDWVQRDVLLWASITLEMPVFPKAAANVWLVDFRRRVLVHVYDDRGMDVIATDREVLKFAYERFNDWLLDNDRERMAATFG